MTAKPQVYYEDVQVGHELPELRTVVTPRQLVMFAGASLDFYEIHYDRDFAKNAGLQGLLVHGALKNALLGRFLHEWVAPRGRVLSYGCRYRGMDAPGEELVCRAKVSRKREDAIGHLVHLDIGLEKADGTVTTPGEARITLPNRDGPS